MTTIATDGLTMAADGRVTGGGFIHSDDQPKLFRLSDGRIVGIAGSLYNQTTFLKWLEGGEADDLSLDEEFEGLVLHRDGRVQTYNCRGKSAFMKPPVVAGSGGVFAAVAMDAGCSPEDAVRHAMKRDCASGGTITAMTRELPAK